MDYYRLLFTQRALNDLAEIVGYIAKDDDEAASRFGTALLDHVDLLKRFPRILVAFSRRFQYNRMTLEILWT